MIRPTEASIADTCPAFVSAVPRPYYRSWPQDGPALPSSVDCQSSGRNQIGCTNTPSIRLVRERNETPYRDAQSEFMRSPGSCTDTEVAIGLGQLDQSIIKQHQRSKESFCVSSYKYMKKGFVNSAVVRSCSRNMQTFTPHLHLSLLVSPLDTGFEQGSGSESCDLCSAAIW